MDLTVFSPALSGNVFKRFPLAEVFPFRSNFIEVDNQRMHYIDEGAGPVVICFHGNPTWSFFFRKLIKHLSQNFRVIAADYIGCGLSDHPAQKHYRASDRVKQMQQLIDKLGLDSYSFVMHDWGGPIGAILALSDLAKVEKLIFLNTTLTETDSLPQIIKIAALPIIGKFLTKRSKSFLKLMTRFGVVKKLPKLVERAYLFPYRSSVRRTAIWDFVADIPFNSNHPTYSDMLELAEGLPKLSALPIKIIWGLKDPCFHKEMLSKIATHFPGAEVMELPNASHLVLEDEPEIVCHAVHNFLIGQDTSLRSSSTNANPLFTTFCKTAAEFPNSPAAVEPVFGIQGLSYSQISFKDLMILVHQYQRAFNELGIKAGERVVMLVTPGIEFLALSYALMGRGAIPIFLDPGMGRDNLLKCLREIGAVCFIGSPKAQFLRFLDKKLFQSFRTNIVASNWYIPGIDINLNFLKRFSPIPLEPEPVSDAAFVAFTSGATGSPKGVVFNNQMLREQLRIFKESFKFTQGLKDLPLLPIFSLFTVPLGVCSVFPPMDISKPLEFDSAKVLKVIKDLNIDTSFGSPTLWNKLAEYCIRSSEKLQSIKRIYMAGAPVPTETLTKLQGLLEVGEAYTPYGSTEALPVTLISAQDLSNIELKGACSGEEGTLVGKAVSGVEVRVIEPKHKAFESIAETKSRAPLEIGEIIVRGANVSPVYLDRVESTALSKIPDQDTFWHRMGDMGYLDQQGNLYFCGRKAHMVECNGKTYYSIPVERIFNKHKKVRRSALVSLYTGKDVGIVVEPLPQFFPNSAEEKREFSNELLQLAKSSPLTTEISRFYFHNSFPVDGRHNAKIFRDKLGDWASSLKELENAA